MRKFEHANRESEREKREGSSDNRVPAFRANHMWAWASPPLLVVCPYQISSGVPVVGAGVLALATAARPRRAPHAGVLVKAARARREGRVHELDTVSAVPEVVAVVVVVVVVLVVVVRRVVVRSSSQK